MKIDTLKNDMITVNISSFGAELQNIISDNGKEYLWNGDKKYWAKRAPVLFPIVGKMKTENYIIDGKEYKAFQHGFARDNEFDIKSKSDNRIVYSLIYSEETLKIYPFKFEFEIIYSIIGKSLLTEYNIKNLDDKSIYFSIGGHTAFATPGDFTDYSITFEEEETLNKMVVDKNVFFTREKREIIKNSKVLDLDYSLFSEDVIAFENVKSDKIKLTSKSDKDYLVEFEYPDFPIIAFWTKKDYPFICLEPWYGQSDFLDFSGDFRNKDGVLELGVNKNFNCSYIITVN